MLSSLAGIQQDIQRSNLGRHCGLGCAAKDGPLLHRLLDAPDARNIGGEDRADRLKLGDHAMRHAERGHALVDVFDERVFAPALEAEMMAWAVTAVRQRNQRRGEVLTLDASALDSDLRRLEMLARYGFERQSETSLLMACPLTQPVAEPRLPPGFTIRPMGGEAELEAYVALHRAAFGTGNMSVDYRRTIMSAPDYLPELDLVAVAPNDELAAFCVCQIFPDDTPRAGGQREGWTDPIGTHPAYQRLGLAKALMLAGMRLLQSRGMDTALLGTSSENLPMQRLAEAVGFHKVSNTLWYCKAVA